MREKYERSVADRLGISLEAFRAKKVSKSEKKMKKNVAVKGDKAEISRAEKNLAALVKCGKVDLDFEPVDSLDDDELSLIFDELYAKLDKPGLEREAKNLLKKVTRERLEAERGALAEEIRKAEEAEDDDKVDELLREMQKLDKKLG